MNFHLLLLLLLSDWYITYLIVNFLFLFLLSITFKNAFLQVLYFLNVLETIGDSHDFLTFDPLLVIFPTFRVLFAIV